MNASSPRLCRHVYFSGHVQGVGFRYTARRVAAGYEVTGFVRNLPDGRVELVVEGSRPELNAFLQSLQQSMEPYIQSVDLHEEASQERFQTFEIRHL